MKFYAKQLLTGLHEMHKAGICHRDLKLENLVLDADFNLKIIDFGLACPIQGEEGSGFCQERVGTTNHMAPEILLGMRYQPVTADLFSLGVIFFALFNGVMPFSKADSEDKYYKLIALHKQNLFWAAHEAHYGDTFSNEFKDLMNLMFAYQPYQRLNLVEVMAHPFFQQETASQNVVRNEMMTRKAANI